MPAYVRRTIGQLAQDDSGSIVGSLQQAYALDGFASQYTRQTRAWSVLVPKLQGALIQLVEVRPEAREWTVLLEYPLYRLRRRIDLVILAGGVIVVVECKVGAYGFAAEDRRQVEEYALDLRDFHAASQDRGILPVLWSTEAEPVPARRASVGVSPGNTVKEVELLGREGLAPYLLGLMYEPGDAHLVGEDWDSSSYRPVPKVIDAATSIFAGHDVRSIANADADNLESAATCLVALIEQARKQDKRYLLLLTGVPGSGKTLAGLHVVHSAVAMGVERSGDIVYLSGNTPLVIVLREALARDEHRRRRGTSDRKGLQDIRRDVRARIQHITDFLRESLRGSTEVPPHEHVIVFDEAQRAWDEKQGIERFERTASEPALLLELMSRHQDWCACVCLIGGGQEINSGEEGVFGWGEALRRMGPDERGSWSVFAPPDVIAEGTSAGTFTLGKLPPEVALTIEPRLQLLVPQRSYRSPSLSLWVDHVLAGDSVAAMEIARELTDYPLVLSRALPEAKSWLRAKGRGERRYGLLASSGARRLRADGIGVTLSASDGIEIAHWYLNAPGDIRSSHALEVPANEYTSQGLELDFACLCWGGDLLWSNSANAWALSRLSGTTWQQIQNQPARRFLKNSYRVLLTRAREGLILWVPRGDDSDPTRPSEPLDATARFLVRCGARPLA